VNISDSYGVDMCVIRDNSFAGSHVADDISLRINNNLIKIQLFHLSSDCVNVRFFVAALSRVFYNGPQKCGHIFLITLRGLFDFFEIYNFFLLKKMIKKKVIKGNALILSGFPGGGGCRAGKARTKKLKSCFMVRK